ncbi:GNAT family N-acetyltransferase [Glycomyces sp. A-F 0318]|nr:GNAT family N-acetyltransferase [Glycomyces amatae]
MIRWAEEAGASVLRLAVADGNRAAEALYRRNGFRDTGGLGDPMPDGAGRERLMERELGAAAG